MAVGGKKQKTSVNRAMLTHEQIFALEGSDVDSTSISPVLVDPFPRGTDEVGVEVITSAPKMVREGQKEQECGEFVLTDQTDPSTWYQIKSEKSGAKVVSFVLKLQNNGSVWPYPCFIPSLISAACLCRDVVVVAASDTLHFIDSDYGVSCLPAVLVNGGVKFLQSFTDSMVVAVSQREEVLIMHYPEDKKDFSLLFDRRFFGEMPAIKKIDITNEIPSGALSPILFFQNYSVRWSASTNMWVHYQPEPYLFTKQENHYETIADIENEFCSSLIYNDSQRFLSSFKLLLSFYLYGNGSKAFKLIEQLLTRKIEGISIYCNMKIQDILETGMNIIETQRPELYQNIIKSPLYEQANKEHTQTPNHFEESDSESNHDEDEKTEAHEVTVPQTSNSNQSTSNKSSSKSQRTKSKKGKKNSKESDTENETETETEIEIFLEEEEHTKQEEEVSSSEEEEEEIEEIEEIEEKEEKEEDVEAIDKEVKTEEVSNKQSKTRKPKTPKNNKESTAASENAEDSKESFPATVKTTPKRENKRKTPATTPKASVSSPTRKKRRTKQEIEEDKQKALEAKQLKEQGKNNSAQIPRPILALVVVPPINHEKDPHVNLLSEPEHKQKPEHEQESEHKHEPEQVYSHISARNPEAEIITNETKEGNQESEEPKLALEPLKEEAKSTEHENKTTKPEISKKEEAKRKKEEEKQKKEEEKQKKQQAKEQAKEEAKQKKELEKQKKAQEKEEAKKKKELEKQAKAEEKKRALEEKKRIAEENRNKHPKVANTIPSPIIMIKDYHPNTIAEPKLEIETNSNNPTPKHDKPSIAVPEITSVMNEIKDFPKPILEEEEIPKELIINEKEKHEIEQNSDKQPINKEGGEEVKSEQKKALSSPKRTKNISPAKGQKTLDAMLFSSK